MALITNVIAALQGDRPTTKVLLSTLHRTLENHRVKVDTRLASSGPEARGATARWHRLLDHSLPMLPALAKRIAVRCLMSPLSWSMAPGIRSCSVTNWSRNWSQRHTRRRRTDMRSPQQGSAGSRP